VQQSILDGNTYFLDHAGNRELTVTHMGAGVWRVDGRGFAQPIDAVARYIVKDMTQGPDTRRKTSRNRAEIHEWTGPTGVHFRDVRSPGGTFYHDTTPPEVVSALDRAMHTKARVRIFYGDRTTGRDWLEENMVVGTVGRSTGSVPIAILLSSSRSSGGAGILTDSIVRLLVDGREVYRHSLYVVPTVEIVREGIVAGLPWAAIVGEEPTALGEAQARFKTEAAALRWAAFMRGERMSK